MHAYMIIAHNQFELLEKLIKKLDDERNDIFVHIDAKVSDFDFEHFKGITKHSRVIFTDERVSVTWGDYSQVKTEMLLLKTAVSHDSPEKPYTYYHLLSGVDLPIKTNDEIHKFFEENQGKEFIHHTSDNGDESRMRIQYYHFFRKKRNTFTKILAQLALIPQKLARFDRLERFPEIKVQKGCNWFSITSDLAKFTVENQTKWEMLFSHSYCGDEVFIQTVCESSEFKDNLFMPHCNNDHFACARLIDWERGNPYVWRREDYDLIKASPCMFARKFDMNVDSEIIEMLTEE